MKEMFRVTCFLFCLLGTLYLEKMTLLSRVNLVFTERLDITAHALVHMLCISNNAHHENHILFFDDIIFVQ